MKKSKTLVRNYIIVGAISVFSYVYLLTFAHDVDIEILGRLLFVIPALYLIYGVKLLIFDVKKPTFEQAINKFLFSKTKSASKSLKSIVPVTLGILATGILILEVFGDGSIGDLVVVLWSVFAIGGYVIWALIAHFLNRPKKVRDSNSGELPEKKEKLVQNVGDASFKLGVYQGEKKPTGTGKPFKFLRLSNYIFPLAAYLTFLVLVVALYDARQLITYTYERFEADATYDEIHSELSLLQVGSAVSELDAIVDIDHKYRGRLRYKGEIYKYFNLQTEILDLEDNYFEQLNLERIEKDIFHMDHIRTRLAMAKFLEELATCTDNPRLITVYYGSLVRSENPITYLVSDAEILGVSTFLVSDSRLQANVDYNEEIIEVDETGSLNLCGNQLSEYLAKTFVSETNDLNIFPINSCKRHPRENYLIYYRDDICPFWNLGTDNMSPQEYKDELIDNIVKEGLGKNE